MNLRYRLEIGGLGLDVFADDDVDLTSFDARAARYARPEGIAADEVLEVRVVKEMPVRAKLLRILENNALRVEAAGATLTMTLAPGRAHATLASGASKSFEIALRILMSRRLVQAGGVMLHAAALRDHDIAVAFPGVSGAGKSTLMRRHPEEGRLAEDLVAVRPQGQGGFLVESLPFIAKQGATFQALDVGPLRASLAALAFPRHANDVSITPLEGRAVLAKLARAVVSFAPEGIESLLLDRLLALTKAIPGFELRLNRTTPYWEELRNRIADLVAREATCAA